MAYFLGATLYIYHSLYLINILGLSVIVYITLTLVKYVLFLY